MGNESELNGLRFGFENRIKKNEEKKRTLDCEIQRTLSLSFFLSLSLPFPLSQAILPSFNQSNALLLPLFELSSPSLPHTLQAFTFDGVGSNNTSLHSNTTTDVSRKHTFHPFSYIITFFIVKGSKISMIDIVTH